MVEVSSRSKRRRCSRVLLHTRKLALMPPTPYHILVIDADDGLCAFFDTLLSNEGYIVDCAPSAAAVPALLATTQPDLIISDLGCGREGQGDFEILALLDADAKHCGLLVLFCTAWDERVLTPLVAALGRPHTALLAKPFDLDALLGAIARGCAGRPMTPARWVAVNLSRAPAASAPRREVLA